MHPKQTKNTKVYRAYKVCRPGLHTHAYAKARAWIRLLTPQPGCFR